MIHVTEPTHDHRTDSRPGAKKFGYLRGVHPTALLLSDCIGRRLVCLCFGIYCTGRSVSRSKLLPLPINIILDSIAVWLTLSSLPRLTLKHALEPFQTHLSGIAPILGEATVPPRIRIFGPFATKG